MATLGADPELFVRNEEGTPVPICGLIGGTKSRPKRMRGLDRGFAVQEDNVMLEFNVPPAVGLLDFRRNIHVALSYIDNLVRTKSLWPLYESELLFPASDLNSRQAATFGCSPAYNAYAMGAACPRIQPDMLVQDDGRAWRFAGGHLHIGVVSSVPQYVMAQMCDLYIGLHCVSVDKQPVRRGLYGQAGTYRPTPYGIEYRVLSNFWLWDESLTSYIASKAFDLCSRLEGEASELARLYAEVPWDDVAQAINDEDASLAARIIRYVNSLKL